MKKVIFAVVAFGLWVTVAFAEPAAVVDNQAFTLQVGAFVLQSAAEKVACVLEEKGLAPYVLANKGGLFVVRLGAFATRKEARQAAARLDAEGAFNSSLIVKTTVPPQHRIPEQSQATAPPEPSSDAAVSLIPPSEEPATEEAESVPAGSVSPGQAGQENSAGSRVAGTVLEIMARHSSNSQSLGFRAAQLALDYLGVKYRLGGMSRETGMDCSGFVKTVYALFDINLPRTSRDQFHQGRPVDRGELAAGDLVFFGLNNQVSHVGIYLAEGKFIHAPRSRETIRISNLEERSYLRRFLGARRLLFDD